MRTLIAAAAGLIALAAPFSATATHKPGHGNQPANADLTIAANPNPLLWGTSTAVTGRLKGPDNGAKTVELDQSPYPFTANYESVAEVATNDKGEYTFTVKPELNTKYRVTAKVDPPVLSGELFARVRMRINRRVSDRTPSKGHEVTFSGQVAPAHDGRFVHIQRRDANGVWRTVARTALVDAGEADPTRSAYSRAIRINRDGTFRTLIKSDGDHAGNKSRRVRLDVP